MCAVKVVLFLSLLTLRMEIANLNKEFKQGDQKAGFTLVADQWNYNFDTFQTGSVGPSSAQPRVEFFFFFFTVLLQDGEQRNR